MILPGLLLLTLAADAPFRVYVADLDASSATLAWGRANGRAGRNTIGRDAVGGGNVVVKIDGRAIASPAKSWVRVDGLKADTVYPYTIERDGVAAASGQIRTWPSQTDELTFFVIGDFGDGTKRQYEVAKSMEEERLRLERSGIAVRFVVTTGDNLYGKISAGGSNDADWERKFFLPYGATLAAIPFKAVLGNHDGSESEAPGDLPVCLDNFFMPARWYRFTYGSFAEFFALDSPKNQDATQQPPAYLAGGPQSRWLEQSLAQPALPWRIALMHHPMFTAGPEHPPALPDLRHWFDAFRRSSVQMVFSGHEHNLQISERNEATGGMQFVLSGAGGELRKGDVRKKMKAAHIRAWSNLNHFVVVRIQSRVTTFWPVGGRPIQLLDAVGNVVQHPIAVAQNGNP